MEKPEEIIRLEWELEIEIERKQYKTNNNRVISLDLERNEISNIVPLAELSELESVYLGDNNISDISALKKLKNLKILDLSYNTISNISALEKLEKLTWLCLRGNNIIDISYLSQIYTLNELILDYNKIGSVSSLANLINLKHLDLEGNVIEDISAIGNLMQLNILYLAHNKIREIDALANLNNLELLDIASNKITHIPENFINQIKLDYSLNVIDGDKAEQIFLFNNPLLPEIKQAIESNGREGLLAYYDNLKKGKKPFNEAKLIFLGEPFSGKTSLMEYLLGKPFVEKDRVMTKGVNLEKWRIKEEYQGKTNDYCINFWDFGGQEIQQSIHQFFLTEGTLYIILLNAETDEQPDKYLSYLNNYAPDSPFIIVINKIEAHPSAKITTNLISEDYAKRYINTFRVSIKEASQGNKPFVEQMEALEKSIRQTLMSLPYIHQEVPKSYFDVKQNLEEKYAKKVPYLSNETYLQICKENDVVAETEDDLLKYLNLLGTVRFLIDQICVVCKF